MVETVKTYGELIRLLVKSGFYAHYNGMKYSVFISIISPFSGVVAWVFLKSTNLFNPGTEYIPYPYFIMAGTLFWSLIMSVASQIAATHRRFAFVLKQGKTPIEVLFIVQLFTIVIPWAISFLLLSLFLSAQGYSPYYSSVFCIPFLIPLIVMGFGMGLVYSIMNYLSPFLYKMILYGTGFLFFITPVIYSPLKIENQFIRYIMKINPFNYLLCTTRDVLLCRQVDAMLPYTLSIVFVIFFIIVVWKMYGGVKLKIIESIL